MARRTVTTSPAGFAPGPDSGLDVGIEASRFFASCDSDSTGSLAGTEFASPGATAAGEPSLIAAGAPVVGTADNVAESATASTLIAARVATDSAPTSGDFQFSGMPAGDGLAS